MSRTKNDKKPTLTEWLDMELVNDYKDDSLMDMTCVGFCCLLRKKIKSGDFRGL